MAKVHLLRGFDDLDLIDRYAQKFGLDPDWVYDHTSFGTIINFAVKWHLEHEFQERYQFIWHSIHEQPTK
jgi:hypothetical protein